MHVLAAAAAAVVAATSPVGAYRFGDGSLVALVPQDGGVRYVDYSTGALRQLTQWPGRLLEGGPGVSVQRPVTVRLRLDARGLWRDGELATPVPLVTEYVTFRNGVLRLAGRILKPPGPGPFPAVVLVPGAPKVYRDTYDLWAYFFASQGYAVLTYDKRGVGGSAGRYVRAATDQNLSNQAADALGGVLMLQTRKDIDPNRIGLSGGSQAGWTIALAASRSRAVRFAAIQSGAGMSVGRQLGYSALTREGSVDVTPEQIDAALANVPDSGFDPRPALASLQIPVLWQLGSLDKRMHTAESVADIRAIPDHDFTVVVYDGGAHSLRLTAHGTSSEEKTSPGLAPTVFSDLQAWLKLKVS